MRQRLCKAVCGNVVGDIIRGGLGGVAGVAHGDADPGIFQHRHVVAAVAEGDGLLPRQAQMGQRVGQAVGLAAARGQNITEIRVPSHSNAAGAAAQKLRLVFLGQKGAQLVDGVGLDARGDVALTLLQIQRKLAAQIVDVVEQAEILTHKADGDTLLFNIRQQRAQGGAVNVPAVQRRAVGQIAVLAVHRHVAVKRDAVQRVQVRQVHRRAACGNERFDAVFAQRGQRLHGRFRQGLGVERQQRAVNIKKCGLDLCHGGAPYSRLRLRPISAISALRASSLPSRMASTA